MVSKKGRIVREKETIRKMVSLYCRRKHRFEGGLCPECRDLAAYAYRRLDLCQFGENKTTCAKCTVHCYKPEMRAKIRRVMRFAGPRMLIYHPIEAIRHALGR